MPITIGTNIGSLTVQRRLSEATGLRARSSERLASGSRINRPSDDAAGLSIQQGLLVNSRVYAQGIRNLSDGQSFLSVSEGSLQSLSGLTIRLTELASQAANGSFSRNQRLTLQAESDLLLKEFNRIVDSTSFNGLRTLDGSLANLRLQAGYGLAGGIGTVLNGEFARAAGNRTFTQRTVTASTTSSVIQGDFNGDGKLDLVSASAASTQLSVRLGNGDGSFAAATTLSVAYSGARLAIGDVDGDGDLDLVANSTNGVSHQTRLFRNNGGTFTNAQTLAGGGAVGVGGISLADLNGDGRADLVLNNLASHLTRLSTGAGLLSSTTNIVTPSVLTGGPSIVADVNNDGKQDLLLNDIDSTQSFVVLGNGDGTFGSQILLSATSNVQHVGDFNRDGLVDLVSFDLDGNSYIDTQSGNLTFSRRLLVASLSVTGIGDLDGDGYVDFLTSADTQMRGRGDGTFGSQESTSFVGGGLERLLGDLNGDGIADVTTYGGGGITSYVQGATTSSYIKGFSLITAADARSALSLLEATRNRISGELGSIGAMQSRLQSGLAALVAERENSIIAASRIGDTDVAAESAELVRTGILQEVGSALLAQANLAPRIALQLLSG